MASRVENCDQRTLEGARFRSAERVQQALTATLEKRALLWLAERMPNCINSDHLTALGLLAQLGAGVCYAWARQEPRALLAVATCIALNWFGDSLDGTLARVRNQQRPRWGFYVDHVCDVLGSMGLMLGLACSGYVHPQVAVAMLLAFLVLAAESFLATYTLGRFQMSQGIFGPTEIRILLIIGTVALMFHPYSTLFGHRFLLFDAGGVIATCGMAAMAVATTVEHGRALYRAEPLR